MPRRLLRDGRVVADDWQYLTEIETAVGAGGVAGADGAAPDARADAMAGAGAIAALIIPLASWRGEHERWAAHQGRLGIVLLPADKVEHLAADLARFALIAAEFPGPSDGRGYTQGRLLRERHRFAGELRAMGYVRHDQLFFLARCGFNSFELPENELADAGTAFTTFSAEYQPSNDVGLGRELRHR